jgi:hypothetical protein
MEPEATTETTNVTVSAWAARGQLRREARGRRAKRALRMQDPLLEFR